LCLRFTRLALNSHALNACSPEPTIITDKQKVWQCNVAALRAGVRADMGINHALMLLPELCMLERDTALEVQKLQELSFWAYRFTSLVSIYNEHSLLLEIGKSSSLFNGLEHLLHLISSDIQDFQIDAARAVAHTAKAAYVLSFAKQAEVNLIDDSLQQLLKTPISCLDIEQKTKLKLGNCGFDTLADIDSITYADLGQRLGVEFLDYLDQLWGRVADPQIATTPPETFAVSADFAEPISNLTWINQQLDRLLEDLAQFITLRQLICRSFTWRFYHENNRLLQTITIALSSNGSGAKQNCYKSFRELTDLKLDTIKLDWEFSSIELSSNQLVPAQLFNDDLFDPQPDQQKFQQLIDKLTNRLGANALFRVYSAAEHLPELANGRQHANTPHLVHENSEAYTLPSHTPLKDEPLWLLENPQRLAQHISSQQRSPLYEGPLNIIHGPDRISSHWWSKPQNRDYFIARQKNGRLLWIFFDRGEKCWFLHGLFA
jgi:protein ImuB